MVCQGGMIRFDHHLQKGWQSDMEERIYEEEELMVDSRLEDIYTFLGFMTAVGYIAYQVFNWLMYI